MYFLSDIGRACLFSIVQSGIQKMQTQTCKKKKKTYKQVVIDNMLHHQYVISQIIDTFNIEFHQCCALIKSTK